MANVNQQNIRNELSLTVKTNSHKDSRFYNMNHRNQGLAYIFIHKEFKSYQTREGAEAEVKKLKQCLLKLGFDVHCFMDLRADEIKDWINKASEMDHTDNNCFFVAVISHGREDLVAAADIDYDPKVLWSPFTANKCPTLAGKPKIFLMAHCQGEKTDAGIKLLWTTHGRTEYDGDLKTQSYTIPVLSDFCIMYATAKDHLSFRNPVEGSYFITIFCEELEKHATQEHLITILTFVNRRVAVEIQSHTRDPKENNKKQSPYFICSFTRLLKFEHCKNKNGTN